MLKKIVLFLLMVSLGSVVLAQDTVTECPLSDETLNVVWVSKSLTNSVFALGQTGAEVAAEELSESSPCDIDLIVAAPLNTDSTEQVDLIYEIIELGNVDAIAVSCINDEACVEPINAAVEAGIAVMTWDSDSPESDRFTYLGVDNYEGGQVAADLLIREMGTSGQVALLTGQEQSANLNLRIEGFSDVMADYEDIEIVEIVYTSEDPQEGVEGMERVMETYPELDGWFMVGLWPLATGRGAMPLWEAASLDDEVYTVVFDTLPFQLELLKDGYLVGLVGQKYWGWGYDSLYIIHDHIINGTEYDDFTNSGMDIVTTRNVEFMIEAWENVDFSQPLPPAFDEETSESSEDKDAS
jgi:ribose transport system substrate-binding protein